MAAVESALPPSGRGPRRLLLVGCVLGVHTAIPEADIAETSLRELNVDVVCLGGTHSPHQLAIKVCHSDAGGSACREGERVTALGRVNCDKY